jgi:thioredoxin 1
MSDSDEIETIREQKRKALKAQLGDDDDSSSADGLERPDTPVHIEGGEHLDRVTDDHDVVLVDFYADWCGPCKMVEPIVEALHEDGTAVVAKVDIDQHQALAQAENVRGVPTILLVVDGQPAERVVGAKDKNALEALIAKHT